MKKCFLLFFSMSWILGAQELEYTLEPSNEVRYPPAQETSDPNPTNQSLSIPQESHLDNAQRPNSDSQDDLSELMNSQLVSDQWYLNLGRYAQTTSAQSTARGIQEELSKKHIRMPGVVFNRQILYLGPLSGQDALFYSQVIASLGWRDLQIYRP